MNLLSRVRAALVEIPQLGKITRDYHVDRLSVEEMADIAQGLRRQFKPATLYDWYRRTRLPFLAPSVSGGLPGTTIGTQMNNGYLGQYSRNTGGLVIAPRLVNPTDTVAISFGDAVVAIQNATGGYFSDAAGFIAGGGTFTFAKFAGVAVREVLTNSSSYLTGQNTVGAYQPGQPCDVIMLGNVNVLFSNAQGGGTPVSDGAVYLRVSTNAAGTFVGAFEAAADGAHTVQLTNCQWTTGIVDANSVAEISILTRNLA